MKTYLSTLCLSLFFIAVASAQCPQNDQPGVHTVQKGETLYRIASTYNISVEYLLQWNQMQVGDPLRICQDLYVAAYAVPARGENVAADKIPAEFSEGAPLKRLNPDAPATSSSSAGAYKKQAGKQHVVQAGETIAGLAELYGYSEKRFRELNLIAEGTDVMPGSIILSSDCTCERISYDESKGSRLLTTDIANPTSTGDVITGVTGGTLRTQREKPNEDIYTRPETTSTPTASPTPATNASMSLEELAMVNEINLMRSNPSGYVRYVQAYVADQRANDGFPIDDNAVNELIRELNASPALSTLQPMGCIYTAAQKHGQDMVKMGRTDHQGSDGQWPWDRVLDACPDLTDGNENLVGGPESVRESVIILLIDDGIPNRGHRKTLMRSDWKYVACYKAGKIGFMPNCWVQKFGY